MPARYNVMFMVRCAPTFRGHGGFYENAGSAGILPVFFAAFSSFVVAILAMGVSMRLGTYQTGETPFDAPLDNAAGNSLKRENIMDQRDRDLLNEIQSDFPVEPHPYRVLGRRLGMDEKEVLHRIARLKQEGVIRRLGASINSRKVGFVSTLLAARVPEDKFDKFVATVNACPGVTHNYERDHEYNVWFTLISPSMEEKERTIRSLIERTGIDIYELPAKKVFKIKVDFKF